MNLIKKTKLSILTASLLLGLTSNAFAVNATFDFEANTAGFDTTTFTQTVSGETLRIVGGAEIKRAFDGGVGHIGLALAGNESGAYVGNSLTFSLVSGKAFDLTSIKLYDGYGGTSQTDVDVDEITVFTSSKGTIENNLPSNWVQQTFDVSANANASKFQGITSFTITPSDGNFQTLGFDDIVFSNITTPNTTPTFDAGATNTLTVNEDSGATDIKSLLIVTDTDGSQTLTWSQNSAPSHGSLSFTSATASSGTSVTSGGTITYTPTADYNGSDEFIVKVADANESSTITVNVIVDAVNDTPTFTTTLQDSLIIEKSEITRYTLNVNDIEGGNLNVSVESNDTSIITVTPSWDSSINQARYANESLEFNLTTAENVKGSAKITIIANDGELNSTKSFNIDVDTKVPEVVNIKLDSASSKGPHLSEGDELIFDVEFTEIVIVNGTPQLYFMVDNKQYIAILN